MARTQESRKKKEIRQKDRILTLLMVQDLPMSNFGTKTIKRFRFMFDHCYQKFNVIPYLTPDAESEIAALYSSHVIAMCQLSLQSKQKV